MARSPRFARRCSWLTIIPLMPILLLASCQSSSSSRNKSNNSEGGCCGGGGGGGCCRGKTPTDPPAVAASPPPSPVVDFTPGAPANQSGSVATNALPASVLPTQSPYGGQKTCPVTGHELGSMGAPIPVAVKGQSIYVCCQGCVAKVQANPDFYLRKVQAERGEPSHSTTSQSNSSGLSFSGSGSRGDAVASNTSLASSPPTQGGLYGGQIICPVTGAPLGTMGKPIPVTVKGQTIYVCCRGCVAKVQADPDGYLQKVQAERSGQSHSTSSSSSGCCGGGGGGSCCHGGGGGCCGH